MPTTPPRVPFATACAVAALTTVATAVPPRYFATPVSGLVHLCSPGNPLSAAPIHVTALAEDGRVLGEANCGTTTGESRPFVTSAQNVVAELPHGTFMFTKPVAFLNAGRTLLVGDWCPLVTGTCTTALAIAHSDGSLSVLAASGTSSSYLDSANEQGWAVGGGGASASGAWRIRPDATLEVLDAPGAWGLQLTGVTLGGIAVGSGDVSNQLRAIRWNAAGQAEVLPSIETGTSSFGAGVGLDGSIVGSSNGRAAWWLPTLSPVSLLPVGSSSVATHMAGNSISASPLGYAIFGTHQNELRLFRAPNGGAWVDLSTGYTGPTLTDLEVVVATRPDFMIAQGFTAMYERVSLLWTPQGGLVSLASTIVNPPSGAQPLVAIDANLSFTILAEAGFGGAPFRLQRLAEGDTNGDALVNGTDLATLLSQWGVTATTHRLSADFDGNGTVDGLDLGILLAQW